MAQQILPSNTFTTAKWIVSATSSDGTHTTIATALTSASSGDTIFIRPGTYTENLTLKAGVNLTAFGSDCSLNGTGNVIISGTCTFTAAGSVTISGIQLQTNSAALIAVTGSAASILNMINCYLNCSNNTGITYSSSNASSTINLFQSNGNLGTTGIGLFTHTSAGELQLNFCNITNTGLSLTASTASAGTLTFKNSYIEFSTTTSGTNLLQIRTNHINTSSTNTTALTVGGSGTNISRVSYVSSGTASCISVGSNFEYTGGGISSNNTNVVTGAGTFTYECIACSNSSVFNTTTQTPAYSMLGKFQATGHPAFYAYNSVADNNVTGDGTTYTIINDTKVYDQNTNYNGTTGIFTAPVTGRYAFTGTVTLLGLSASYTSGAISFTSTGAGINGFDGFYGVIRDAGNNAAINIAAEFSMTAGDTNKLVITVTGSTKTINVAAGIGTTWFSGHLIC